MTILVISLPIGTILWVSSMIVCWYLARESYLSVGWALFWSFFFGPFALPFYIGLYFRRGDQLASANSPNVIPTTRVKPRGTPFVDQIGVEGPCPICATSVPEGIRYCPTCGTQVRR